MVRPLSDRRVIVRCALLAIVLSGAACRGEARQTSANDATLARMVDSLRAPVERAVGLVFTSPPRSAMRTKEQVRGYLIRKLDERLREETGVPVQIAADPLSSVVLGAGQMLSNLDLLKKVSLD